MESPPSSRSHGGARGGRGRSLVAPRQRRLPSALWVSSVCAVIFVVLTVLVAAGTLQSVDVAVAHHFRPSAEFWGDTQNRYSPWMSRLEPTRMFSLFATTCVFLAAWRRSAWPVLFCLMVCGTTATVTLLVKFALGRGDPFGYVPVSGGSYPSGHMAAVVVCLGGCLFVARPKVRWWWWTVVVAAGGLMGAALLVSAAHWATDVVGGVLLGVALVTWASRLPLRRRSNTGASVT